MAHTANPPAITFPVDEEMILGGISEILLLIIPSAIAEATAKGATAAETKALQAKLEAIRFKNWRKHRRKAFLSAIPIVGG